MKSEIDSTWSDRRSGRRRVGVESAECEREEGMLAREEERC